VFKLFDIFIIDFKRYPSTYSGVKVFRFMTEFRFLEVGRGHFSKLCKSIEKTRGGMGLFLSCSP